MGWESGNKLSPGEVPPSERSKDDRHFWGHPRCNLVEECRLASVKSSLQLLSLYSHTSQRDTTEDHLCFQKLRNGSGIRLARG